MRDALVRAHASRRTLVTAVCSCGCQAQLGVTQKCPACGAPDKARLNKDRADLLEELSDPSTIAVAHIRIARCPLLGKTMVKLKLITPDVERSMPGKKPLYKLTETGVIARDAYRVMRAELRERAAIAGATAARHADIPEAP